MDNLQNAQNLYSLVTDRQIEIVKLMSEGRSSKQISAMLGISPRTVENQRYKIMKKTGCANSNRVVSLFTQAGIIV